MFFGYIQPRHLGARRRVSRVIDELNQFWNEQLWTVINSIVIIALVALPITGSFSGGFIHIKHHNVVISTIQRQIFRGPQYEMYMSF